MSRLISLAHLTVMKADPVDLVEIAAGAGFDTVGIRIQPSVPGNIIIPVVNEPQTVKAIKRKLGDTGVRLLDIEAFWINPDSDLASFKRAYEVGAELGARFALVAGNDPDTARLTDRFAQTCEDARSLGLFPMLEFVTYSTIRSIAEAYHLIQAAGVRDAGILVDALHLSRSGDSPATLADYPNELFHYAHLCDAKASPPTPDKLRLEAFGGRLYPGEGELWINDFIAAFPSDAPFAVEAPSGRHEHLTMLEQARAALKATKALLSAESKT